MRVREILGGDYDYVDVEEWLEAGSPAIMTE